MILPPRRLPLLAATLALVALAAPGAHARPDRAARLKLCDELKADPKYQCYSKPKATGAKDLALNLHYGWAVGGGHPISNIDPPGYDKLLNGLDQCAWFHDRGAWKWNPRTKVCETWKMCSNTVGLFRCLSAYQPETPDEAEARKIALHSIARVGEVCIRKLYKEYGVEFARDEHGSAWLTPKSTRELADAFAHCKPGMATPGWDQAAALQGLQK